MPRTKARVKFVAVSSLFSLSIQDVVNYVQALHHRINKQNKKINKLKLKLKKMVNFWIKIFNKFCYISDNNESITFRHSYQN